MRGWIPPFPFALGILSFGLSWIALFEIARGGSFGPSFLAFGWLHIVTLGWISLIALSVLLYAVPEFLDAPWKSRPIATACTLFFALGVALLLVGFFCASAVALQIGAAIALVALIVYTIAIVEPLRFAMRGTDRVSRAVARAFSGTFAFFVLTALLGTAFAYAVGGHLPAVWLQNLPHAHAILGIGGWLTLLVVGVSARTMGPIAGARARRPLVHIIGSSTLMLGIIVAAVGAIVANAPTAIVGCALLIVGTAAYATDIADIMKRATVRHRPPQILMLFAASFAIVAAILALCAATGKPTAGAAIFAALIGWIGSAILAHIHHIGVRVLLTTTRGENDETRPEKVLTPAITWTTLTLYELAAITGTLAAITATPITLSFASATGFIAFITLLVNLAKARRNAQKLPVSFL